MTYKELYLEARRICPKDYLTIGCTLQDSQPGSKLPTTKCAIYHTKYGSFEGSTPEQVLASFRAKLMNEPDPQLTPLDNINV